MPNLIDPFDEPVENGEIYSAPKMIDNGGLIDPFDEPEQQEQSQQTSQPAQSADVVSSVAQKVEPAAWEKFKSLFANKEEGKAQGGLKSGIEETVFQTGMGILGSVVGGIEGTASALTPPYDESNLPTAVNKIQNRQQQYNQFGEPLTQAGDKGVEVMGDVMGKVVDVARVPGAVIGGIVADTYPGGTPQKAIEVASDVREKGFGKTMGNFAAEKGASPLVATAVEMAPELLGAYYGIKNYKGAKNAAIAERIKEIESGSKNLITKNDAGLTIPKDKKLLEFTVNKDGQVVKDSLFKSLTKQGFEPKNIPTYRSSNASTKQKLVEIVQRKRAEMINPTLSIEERAPNVAGNSVMQRFNFIKDKNMEAGAALDGVADKLKGQQVDFEPPVKKFLHSLKKLGIKANNDGSLNYDTSNIRRLNEAQKPIEDVLAYLKQDFSTAAAPDAYTLHELKRYIDNIVDYGKSGNKPAVRSVDKAIKALRHDIDKTLDTNFPEYNQVNTVYADTKQSLSKLEDLMGKKISLADDTADTAVGTKLRGLTSNAQYRVPLIHAIRDLENTAAKYGAKFDDDLAPQLILLNDLERIAGSSAKTSMQGQFENVLDKSKLGLAKDTIKRMRDGVLNKDVDEALNKMEEYLKAYSGESSPWE